VGPRHRSSATNYGWPVDVVTRRCRAVLAQPCRLMFKERCRQHVVLVPSGLSIVYFTLEPVIQKRVAVWLASLILIGIDLSAAAFYGTGSATFLVVNDVVVLLIVIGVSNLWAQSGMRARHLVLLAAILTVYDFVATSQLPLMTDLFGRVNHMPLAPFLAWAVRGQDLAIGIGDLLMAATFALTMRKAYGRRAGAIAINLALVGIVIALALVRLQIVHRVIPAMVILGPLMLAQYVTWRRRHGLERTTRQYLAAEPVTQRPRAMA
jgi:hypothetical protein